MRLASSLRPRDARTVYLNGHTPEQAAAIVVQADRLGPGPDDADWLVAKAAADAAKRIEAAAKAVEEAAVAAGALGPEERAALFEQLDRIESMKPIAAPPAVVHGDLSAQLDRIEKRLGQTARGKPVEADAGARAFRDLVVFLIALMSSTAAVVVGLGLPSPITIIGAFALGLAAALAYVHFAPIVTRRQ